MQGTWTEDCWREKILRRSLPVSAELLARLAAKLEQGEDFPTDTPPKLCRVISAFARIIAKYLPQTPADQLQHVGHLLTDVAAHLRFAERSRMTQTPWSMVQATEAFLKRHVGDTHHFLIRPQWTFNYGIVGDFPQVYRTELGALSWIPLSEWEKLIGLDSDQKIFCISFPRSERLNAIWHVSWGHELGHILVREWLQDEFDKLWRLEDGKIRTEIEKELSRNPPQFIAPLFKDTFIKSIAAQQTKQAMEIARQGLEELICDAVGVHLLGPAVLAFVCEFSARFSPDESPLRCGSYPPWRYRIRLMVEACKEDFEPRTVIHDGRKFQYPGPEAHHYIDWLKEASSFVSTNKDKEILEGNIVTREAYRVIETNLRMGINQTLGHLRTPIAQYRLHDRIMAINDLVQKLKKRLPPNEVGTWPHASPARLEDILNAAWAFRVAKCTTDPKWGTPDDHEEMFRLVLKAIEASYVHSTFGPKLANGEPV